MERELAKNKKKKSMILTTKIQLEENTNEINNGMVDQSQSKFERNEK